MEDIYSELEKIMPPVFSRVEAARMLGGMISVGRLSNLDSQGQGPQGRIFVGKKCGYERSSFISWLRTRGDKASVQPKPKPKSQE